ncbi:MAG: hypothetical protein AVDCRST_MAG83-747, partial [uncultured Arthrobacter sp.]
GRSRSYPWCHEQQQWKRSPWPAQEAGYAAGSRPPGGHRYGPCRHRGDRPADHPLL